LKIELHKFCCQLLIACQDIYIWQS